MGKEEELKRKEQIDNLKKDLEAYNSSIPGKLNVSIHIYYFYKGWKIGRSHYRIIRF